MGSVPIGTHLSVHFVSPIPKELPAGISSYFKTVPKATASPPPLGDHYLMRHTKRMKERDKATRASVLKEMAKPRMSKSARIAQRNLGASRIPQHPSVTMPGTVDRIIPSPDPLRSEKAQIAVDGAHYPYRDLRIENTLTDENGDDVKLKKGARVEVTVASDPKK